MHELVDRIRRRLLKDYTIENPISDTHIAGLIQIVEGIRKGPFSAMSRNGEERNETVLKNQLFAISELGKSENPDALSFLRWISSEEVKRTSSFGRGVMQGSGEVPVYDEDVYELHMFPNTRGPLFSSLAYEILVESSGYSRFWISSEEEKNQQIEKIKSGVAHQALNTAIASLEENIKAQN